MSRTIVLIDILWALFHANPYGEELMCAFLARNAIKVSLPIVVCTAAAPVYHTAITMAGAGVGSPTLTFQTTIKQ